MVTNQSNKATSSSYTNRNTTWHKFKKVIYHPFREDRALIFATWQLIPQYFGTMTVASPPRLKRALLERNLVIWLAMEVRHILEYICWESHSVYGRMLSFK